MNWLRSFFFISILTASTAQATSFRTNLLVSTYANELSTRSNSSVLIGPDAFSIGAYVIYEAPHAYQRDQSFGAAFRVGKDFFFEMGAGLFQRDFEGVTGKGTAGFLLLGWRFGGSFNISANLTAKKITEGLEPRTMIDAAPTLGWTFDL